MTHSLNFKATSSGAAVLESDMQHWSIAEEDTFMSSHSQTIESSLKNAGNDLRNRITDFASKVRTEALDAREAISNTLDDQCAAAAKALAKTRKKAARLSRHYPLQIFLGALAVGFLIGRIRR
jgi:hypothetical protein